MRTMHTHKCIMGLDLKVKTIKHLEKNIRVTYDFEFCNCFLVMTPKTQTTKGNKLDNIKIKTIVL